MPWRSYFGFLAEAVSKDGIYVLHLGADYSVGFWPKALLVVDEAGAHFGVGLLATPYGVGITVRHGIQFYFASCTTETIQEDNAAPGGGWR